MSTLRLGDVHISLSHAQDDAFCRMIQWRKIRGGQVSQHQTVLQIASYVNDFQTLNNADP